jgi:membrane protein DedA with SNARE-associated domain
VQLEPLIIRYGLIAILLGAGIEGEAVVVTGGVLAHRGLVPLWPACLCAAIGSCAVDQAWFALARRFRDNRWVARARAKAAFAKALRLLERHPTAFILGFRFIYGIRTVSPIAIGTSHVPARKFVPLNMLAAAVWGPAFTLIGYWFGAAIDPLLDRMLGKAHVVMLVIAAMLAAALLIHLARQFFARD